MNELQLLLKYVKGLTESNCKVFIQTEQFGNYMHFDRMPFTLGITRIAREYLEIIFTNTNKNLTIVFGSEIYSLYSKIKFLKSDNVSTKLLSQNVMEDINDNLKKLVTIPVIDPIELEKFNIDIESLK